MKRLSWKYCPKCKKKHHVGTKIYKEHSKHTANYPRRWR